MNLKKPTLSRRSFMAASAISLTAASCKTAETQVQQTPHTAIDHQNNLSIPASPRTLAKSRITTVKIMHTDIVVAGGGMAGVCAALAAARNGARVVLIQDRSVLGGNASSEIRMHIVGADSHGSRKDTDARESGILEEIRLEEAVTNPQRSASMLDYILYNKVRMEANITLLLDSVCVGVEMKNSHEIAAVQVLRHGTEDAITIHADIFIDCTGDGRLGAEAGALFRMGREGKDEFSESLAPAKPDSYTLGSSILFTSKKQDKPVPFVAPAWADKYPACSDLPHRGHDSWEYGYWWIEWGGTKNIIKDGELIREDLMAVALGVWDHIKNSGKHPGSENWALDWIGFTAGKRESRRFVGDYLLNENDCRKGETFTDGIAYGGWNLDLHDPDGVHTSRPPFTTVPIPLYNIPYRSLYSKNIHNLMFAGRNISTTHVAFGSTRVMGTCAVAGQAAGTAAALCIKHRCDPRELGQNAAGMLQQQLLKDDAYIIGAVNSDQYDICRTSTVKASSEISGTGSADSIINGIQRGVYQNSNLWISDPAQTMPQSIELKFKESKKIKEIHVVFDTGLNRQLTLSQSDSTTRQMIRGPQPETVRDYEIQVLHGESAKTVVAVEGNYQRKRRHCFDSAEADGLRLIVKSTNGDPSAKVFEIRGYE